MTGAWLGFLALMVLYLLRPHDVWAILAELPVGWIGSAVAVLGATWDHFRGRRFHLSAPICWFAGGLCAWSFAGVVSATEPATAWAVSLEMAKATAVLVLAGNAMKDRRAVSRILAVVVGCAVVLAVAAVALYVSGRYTGPRIQVLDGQYGGPNELAVLLVACVPFSMAAALAADQRRLRIAGAVSTLMLAAGVCACQSKGGYLGIFMVGAVFLVRDRWRSVPLLAAAAVVFLVLPHVAERVSGRTAAHRPIYYRGEDQAPVVGEQAPAVRHRVLLLFDLREKSTIGRLVIWSRGLRLVLEHPILGVGAGCFRSGYASLPGSEELAAELRSRSAHSTYLQAAAEHGLPGLSLFLAILGTPFLRWWLRDDRSSLSGDHVGCATLLALGVMIFMVAFLDHFRVWGLLVFVAAADAAARPDSGTVPS